MQASTLEGRRIALGVTGSVAAYKAVLLLRLLLGAGARVQPVLTRGAREFVGALTFSGLSGSPVPPHRWEASAGGELHVELARESELVVVAPATADFLARLATGRADDLLSALALTARCPVLLAPAMHPAMWEHPATRRNVATLLEDGRALLVGPVHGEVASGEVGLGRMAEPEAIAAAVEQALGVAGDLSGRRVVVTAGPTVEDVDPVRFLSNRSSGKMGYALAERARRRGATVTLLSGPTNLPAPVGVRRVDIRSARDLAQALDAELGPDLQGADALLMAAAVGDFRPAEIAEKKLEREGGATLSLVENPDLLAGVGARRGGARPVLVGFAVQTGGDDEVVARARAKLERKRVDLVVANPAAESLGLDTNRVALVGRDGVRWLPTEEKSRVADEVLSEVVRLLGKVPQ